MSYEVVGKDSQGGFMQVFRKTGLSLILGTMMVLPAAQAYEVAAHEVPVPDTVSPALQQDIAKGPSLNWNQVPSDAEGWRKAVSQSAQKVAVKAEALAEQLKVSIKESRMAGVRVFILTPSVVRPENKGRILLHIHGGGYVFLPGKAGLQEGLLMAAKGGYQVVSIDYRMAPDHPYPAAMDDAMAVYREVLKKYPADRIGVFGTSTGGGMTLALVLRARMEGLPLPGAIAPGTPWSDLTKTGDSYFTHEGLDTLLVSYDGFLKGAAEIYANGHDMKDPLLSPVYGDFSGFPATLLTTGTRDLFLSNTIRVHQKMRAAGVDADLIVMEGVSHAIYYLLPPDAPELCYHFSQLDKFFSKHLKQ